MIQKEFTEAVRALSPIEAIAGEHVHLRRTGSQLVGRCPLHPDKTPSFYINPAKGVFKCHGCQAGGDVFEFVRLLHDCSFCESVELLAIRAGIAVDGFKPSPELSSRVAAQKRERKAQMEFKRFSDERIKSINYQYRSLERAATHAEQYLRDGGSDPYLHDLAWATLERFRLFEARVEREGMCDIDILRSEWSRLREAA